MCMPIFPDDAYLWVINGVSAKTVSGLWIYSLTAHHFVFLSIIINLTALHQLGLRNSRNSGALKETVSMPLQNWQSRHSSSLTSKISLPSTMIGVNSCVSCSGDALRTSWLIWPPITPAICTMWTHVVYRRHCYALTVHQHTIWKATSHIHARGLVDHLTHD